MSPSALQPFTFPVTGQRVRSLLIDDDPWFVGRDAALTLGHTNPLRAVREHVPAAHRGVTESVTPSDLHGLDPQTVLISEAGLYRLIMRSNTALAEVPDTVTDPDERRKAAASAKRAYYRRISMKGVEARRRKAGLDTAA